MSPNCIYDRCRGTSTAAVVLVILALLASLALAPAGADVPSRSAPGAGIPDQANANPHSPDQGFIDADGELASVRPSFRWQMEERFGERPSREYVYPDGWTVFFDACSTTVDDGEAARYRWDFGDGGPVVPIAGCRAEHRYDSLGEYDVTLTALSTDGRSNTATGPIHLRDLLVVMVGDSYASGEGNPDTVLPEIAPVWDNGSCHRSWHAGSALAARELEARDTHSSVTFLNLACSGATIEEGLLGDYDGWEPICDGPAVNFEMPSTFGDFEDWYNLLGGGWQTWVATSLCQQGGPFPELEDADFQPQIPTLRDLVCGADCSAPGVRSIDSLNVSIGGNDVGFSEVVKACANPLAHYCGSFDPAQRVGDGLAALADPTNPFGYDALADQIDSLPVEEVYFAEYPRHLFADESGDPGGCGVFSAVGDDEGAWIAEKGRVLNRTILEMTVRRDYRYVEGISEAFREHGYCAEDSWFVGLFESLAREWHIAGALHPNLRGHAEFAVFYLAEWLADHPSTEERWRAEVTIDAVRVVDEVSPGTPVDPDVTARFLATRNGISTDEVVIEIDAANLVPALDQHDWYELDGAQFRGSVLLAEGDAVVFGGDGQLPVEDSLGTRPPKGNGDPNADHSDNRPMSRRVVFRPGVVGASDGWWEGAHIVTSTDEDGFYELELTVVVTVLPLRPIGDASSIADLVDQEVVDGDDRAQDPPAFDNGTTTPPVGDENTNEDGSDPEDPTTPPLEDENSTG